MPNLRKPNKIKELQGTLRKDREGNYLKLVKLKYIPEPPKDLKLNKDAVNIWNFHIVDLVDNGIISKQDLIIFSVFCIELARYFKLYGLIEKKGETFETQTGYPMPRPELSIMRNSFKIAYDIANKFGLTPVSRDQIKSDLQQTEKNEFDEIEEM